MMNTGLVAYVHEDLYVAGSFGKSKLKQKEIKEISKMLGCNVFEGKNYLYLILKKSPLLISLFFIKEQVAFTFVTPSRKEILESVENLMEKIGLTSITNYPKGFEEWLKKYKNFWTQEYKKCKSISCLTDHCLHASFYSYVLSAPPIINFEGENEA